MIEGLVIIDIIEECDPFHQGPFHQGSFHHNFDLLWRIK